MPELLDIRDQQGNLTGETMYRKEVHQAEMWHGVALVWVLSSDGKILLQRRAAHLNAFPEKWDVSLSGHLTAGDEPAKAAVRELAEELGIYVKADELQQVTIATDSFPLTYGKTHHEVDFVFTVVHDIAIDELRLQAAEVLEARWISPDMLEYELGVAGRNRQLYQIAIDAARHLVNN
jgi:isopentenyl-diphosphate Delta-isomerase